jgi:predicted dehydrogenase
MALKIGLLGVAHVHTPGYVECLQAMPGVEMVGLYDWQSARAVEAAAQWGIPALGLDELLDSGLGGVVICAENSHHRPMVEAAAGRVGAILCEKPIATTIADAQAMIETLERTGTRLMIAFPVRYATAALSLRQLLASGTLGTIRTARTTNHGTMPGGWFVDPALAGGGAVMDHTVHVIDMLRWLWPEVEVAEVYAEVGDSLLHPGLGIDDAGLLSFTMTNGVIATLDTSWSRPPSYPIWGDVTVEMTGDKGVVTVDVFSQNVNHAPRNGNYAWVGYGADSNAAMIANFVDMAQTGRQPSITAYDGLKAMEVALAAYESARSGTSVRLE